MHPFRSWCITSPTLYNLLLTLPPLSLKLLFSLWKLLLLLTKDPTHPTSTAITSSIALTPPHIPP
jgi:hypothetical protein